MRREHVLAEMESLTKLICREQKNDTGEVIGYLNREAAAAIHAVFSFDRDSIGGPLGNAAQQRMMKHGLRQKHACITPFETFLMYEPVRMFDVGLATSFWLACCLHVGRALNLPFRASCAPLSRVTNIVSSTGGAVCVCVCVCVRGGV